MAESQAERYKSQGNNALQAGLFADAVDLYTKAIALDPNSSIYFSNRSAAYASLDRFREALDDAQEVVGLKPEWVKGHIRRGNALSGLKKHEEARKAYLKAHQLEPGNTQIEGLLTAAAEAAKKDKEKDWEQDLWSDEEEKKEAEDNDNEDGAQWYGTGASKRDTAGSTTAPQPKRRKASAQVSHQLERSVADASLDSLRACLLQLGKADALLAERMLHLLEGLNAASSAGEDSDQAEGDHSD